MSNGRLTRAVKSMRVAPQPPRLAAVSAGPGWYPDPGGQRGLFRYWDGRAWSATTTDNPYHGVPTAGQGGFAPGGPAASVPGSNQVLPRPTRFGSATTQVLPAAPRRRPIGWILAAVAALVVIVVLAVFAVRGLSGVLAGPPTQDPQLDPSGVVCPTTPSQSPSSITDAGGDRVVSGHLSYPRLSAPFSAPEPDSRTPFGRDVRSQTAVVEQSPDGKTTWVAAVLIARLLAGDGFYGPQQGAAVVAQCVIGKFYGDNPVDRKDARNESTTVDGHPAWIIEMHLTFDIPGIKTKGEQATIVVVDTGSSDGEAGLYSSIPDTSPQFTQPANDALKGLQVS